MLLKIVMCYNQTAIYILKRLAYFGQMPINGCDDNKKENDRAHQAR